jgi:hypothetical protein
VTTDIAVGQMRQVEFLADEEGDWAFHCHKSHHTMNAMGHGVPTMIGVDHRAWPADHQLVPDYMVMGERGMHDMTEMEMPLPDNTAPMMTGTGPLRRRRHGRHVQRAQGAQGPEARRLQGPGLVPAPAGHRGLRVDRRLADPAPLQGARPGAMKPVARPRTEVEVTVRKPAGGHQVH